MIRSTDSGDPCGTLVVKGTGTPVSSLINIVIVLFLRKDSIH
jgi:hypothetical protein